MMIRAPFTNQTLRAFFGRIPSGVLVLAAMVDGEPVGMTVSAFTNVSLDPPMLVVSIRNESSTWPLLSGAGPIGASVLAESQSVHGLQLSTEQKGNRFAEIGFHTAESGAILLDDAAAWCEASPSDVVNAGDHFLVLLTLHAISADTDQPPLIFYRSKFAAVRLES